jgi:CheY-like chemotaxis protein
MDQDQKDAAAENGRTLDAAAFQGRLTQELARVERSGGFVSLAVIGIPSERGGQPSGELALVAPLIRARIRTQDVIGWSGATLALLLPDTDASQALRVGGRLLRTVVPQASLEGASWACGLATVYGRVEGGPEAVLLGAQEALDTASPGTVSASEVLRGRPRVLVIDDDRTFCQALAETITELGWDGFPCTDAADASQRIRDDDYAGLIVDLVMPGRNGVELLREALARRPRLPAVLVSGQDAGSGLVLEALSLGPVTFVQKPISREDLEVALKMFRAVLPGARPR